MATCPKRVFFVVQEGSVFNQVIIEHYFKANFNQKQTKEQFFNFGLHSQGPLLRKIPIYPLAEIGFFKVQEGSVFNQVIIEHYLLAYFIQKETKEQFSNFGLISQGPPFKKNPIWPLAQRGFFLQSRRSRFLTRSSSNIISRRISSKSRPKSSFLILN